MNRTPFAGLTLLLATAVLSGSAGAADIRDLFFAEARYYALQGDYFGALERLDSEVLQHRGVDEPELGSEEGAPHASDVRSYR